MGGIIKAMSCDSMWKYCCNAQHLKSRCCGDFCEVEYDTEMVDIPEENSEYSIEVDGCCEAHSK